MKHFETRQFWTDRVLYLPVTCGSVSERTILPFRNWSLRPAHGYLETGHQILFTVLVTNQNLGYKMKKMDIE
jgi:hypothetical protein